MDIPENQEEQVVHTQLEKDISPEQMDQAQLPLSDGQELQEELVQEESEIIIVAESAEEKPEAETEEPPEEVPPDLPQAPKSSWIKKMLKVIGFSLIRFVGVVCLILLTSLVTAWMIGQYWQQQADLLNEATQNRLNVLMERIEELEQMQFPVSGDQSVSEQLTPAQVYDQNVRAVVAVNAIISQSIFGQVSETGSSGTGFIISADGYIVTNYHVVEGASNLQVLFYDGKQQEAKLIGYDSTNDIAVLKVEAEELPYVSIGSSGALPVGSQVAAIGNPLGTLSSTLTVGYVSAKDRMVTTTGVAINMLQTDAAINSGNSGGPLFNMAGEVVGITTAKYSGYSTSGAAIEGIGFAIPIDDVIDMIEDLRTVGYITGAYLGVTVRDVNAQLAAEYGLPLGTRVEEVVSGVSADRAGIQVGDIIIDLGGYEIENISDLSRALRMFDAGDKTTITVFRSGAAVVLEITLDAKPPEMSTGG